MPDEDTTTNGPDEDRDTEVLSFAMTDRDDTEAADDDDEPHLTPSEPDAGFDGWLDDEQQDPYRELSDKGEAVDEVSDWLAFARGDDDDQADEEAPSRPESGPPLVGGEMLPDDDDGSSPPGGDVEHSDAEGAGGKDLEEPSVSSSALGGGVGRSEPEGDSEELPQDADEHDTSEFDLELSPEDTGDIPGVAAGPPLLPTGGETDDDDTGEVPVIGGDGPTEPDALDAVVEMDPIEAPPGFAIEDVDSGDEPPPVDEITEDDYLGAATQEHVELAAAVAAAEGEATEQVALSADIPGLESASVGFEDVVEEEDVEGADEAAPRGSSDLLLRVGTAVALVGALLLSLLWRPALIVFALAAFIVAAGEFYSALIHRQFRPMSIFGFLGIAGAALGTAAFGVVAIPVALALMATVVLLFNAVSPRQDQPAANFALTVLVAAWIGGLGGFAFDIIAAEDYQVLVIALVATVALVDIAAFFVGRSIGRRPLAPVISPKKTVEGFIAGALTGLAVGAAIGYLVEPIDLPAGLLIGAVVAVFAPIGDLAVSVVKRSLDIKDMGSILPGHGGLLDRIDAVIAAIPAVWVVLTWLALI